MKVAGFPRRQTKMPHRLPGQLIVSLTSYPARFPTLLWTLRSLLDQTVAADRTILWIAHGDRPSLPSAVIRLVEHGLEIRECDDLRSYKKLVPALLEFPDAYIVTADDDLYYRPEWLDELVTESLQMPDRIISHRAHLALRTRDGNFMPYAQWELETHEQDAPDHALLFPTGGAGTLYPPRALHPLVTNAKLFMRLCPEADDVWFFWTAAMAGTLQRRTKRKTPLICWRGSQQVGLAVKNLWNGGNDRQILAIQRHFGKIDR